MQTSSNFLLYTSYKIDIHKKDKQGTFQYIKQSKETYLNKGSMNINSKNKPI